jgi:hypothetical protein
MEMAGCGASVFWQVANAFPGGVVDGVRDDRAYAGDPDLAEGRARPSVHSGPGMSVQVTSIAGTSMCTGTWYLARFGFMMRPLRSSNSGLTSHSSLSAVSPAVS